jgi:hypothetical protein
MRRFSSVVLVACLFLTACGDDEGFTSAPIPAGNLTFINAIPDTPDVSIETNNPRLGSIGFGQSIPNTRSLPQIPLDYRVTFFDQGVEQDVVSGQVTIEIDFSHTFVLTGSFAAPVVTEIIDAPFEYPQGSTETRIRFMNATSGIASATATLTNPNGGSDTVVMTREQPTGFTTTSSGEGVQLEVTDTATGDLIWRSGNFILSPGADRFFMLFDYFGPGDQTARMASINDPSLTTLFLNEELPSGIRVANYTADRGPLDFYVGDNLIATLGYNEVSETVEIDPGTATVTVTPSGDRDTELNSVDRQFFAGIFNTLYVTGLTEGGVGTGLFAENRQRVAVSARLSITKLAQAVGNVDLYFQDAGEALAGAADLNQVTDFTTAALPVVPQAYDFYVTEAGTTNILTGPVTLNLEANGLYSLVISESEGGGEPLQVSLFDDFAD